MNLAKIANLILVAESLGLPADEAARFSQHGNFDKPSMLIGNDHENWA